MKYFETKREKIICKLCAHYCHLSVGQCGICGVNCNEDGELLTKVYGYPSALHVDPIEKKPLYHFLPHTYTLSLGTVGCNFQCPFCQNWEIAQTTHFSKEHYFSPQQIIQLALYHHCKSIAYTYNEPTIFWPYVKDIALLAQQNGLKNVMVSNGFMSDELCEELPDFIDAINIDIKSFNEKYYKQVLKGNLYVVLNNTQKLKEKGLHVEITTLIIPSIDENQIRNIASFIKNKLGKDTPWHLSAYHPDFKMLKGENTPLSILEKYYKIAKEYNLRNVYLGNVRITS
jgi:pyruvate formate lyase activating enzyme